MGAYTATDRGGGFWWLRSPGDDGSDAACVIDVGYVGLNGDFVNDYLSAVRPALFLKSDI
jgi:hypothetical protein